MKAYELGWDLNHLVDQDEDCSVVKFEGLEDFRFHLAGVQKYTQNRQIVLRGNFNVIPFKSDFPVLEIGVPLMSKRMIRILEEDKTVLLNKLDAVIVDDTYLGPIFDENKQLIDLPRQNNDYQFIQLLAFSNFFDKSNSIFKYLRSNPEKVGIIDKLVLKQPIGDFPAIFKIEEKRSSLFINEEAKNKFEKNSILGCTFNEVEVIDT